MNYTDFSQTGGFPLDTDVLDFNHKALAECFKWPAVQQDGTIPPLVILSGCNFVSLNPGSLAGNYMAGWILYNGEPIPFVQSSNIGIGGNPPVLLLNESRQPAVFQDGSTHNVFEVTRFFRYAVNTTGGTVVAPNFNNIPRLEEIAGIRAAELDGWHNFQQVIGSHGMFDVSLRLNPLSRLVYVRGSMNVFDAQNLPSPATRSAVLTLPAKYRPSASVAFAAQHDYHGNANPDDPAIRSISLRIHNQSPPDFDLSVALVRPSNPAIVNYFIRFNAVYPLD